MPRICLIVLLVALMPVPAWAQAADAVIRTTKFPFHGTLQGVDLLAQTFTLAGKSGRILAVTPDTKMMKGGAPATLKDAAPGEEVTGYAEKTPDGEMTAVSVTFGASRRGGVGGQSGRGNG